MRVTKNDFKKVIDKESTLTSIGVNSLFQIKRDKNLSLDESKKELEHQRGLFVSGFDQFEICCDWLSKFEKIKTPQFSSYDLKHVVEKLAGKYVSNGALIAAAIHLGIPMKFRHDSTNAKIAISKKCPYLKQAGPVA